MSWLGVAAASVMIGGLVEMPATADSPCQTGSSTIRYRIIDAGPAALDDSAQFNSFGINSHGQCVGTYWAGTVLHGWIWLPQDAYGLSGGARYDLNVLAGIDAGIRTVANDISDDGVIVGARGTIGQEVGFVWEMSSSSPIVSFPVQPLSNNEGEKCVLFSVNNANPPVAVGYCNHGLCDEDDTRAVKVVLDGTPTLEELPWVSQFQSNAMAMDINNNGEPSIVGSLAPLDSNGATPPGPVCVLQQNGPCEGRQKPARWKPSAAILFEVGGQNYETRHQIRGNNDDDQMCGYGMQEPYPCFGRAVWWLNVAAAAANLHLGITNPFPANQATRAEAVRPDDAGLNVYQVVGTRIFPQTAYLWQRNKTGTTDWTAYPLIEHLCCEGGNQWDALWAAHDINAAGWIIGIGVKSSEFHAFVLIPVEDCEPETGCLGDFNFDGTVGPADLGVLLGSWGNPGCSGSPSCPADLNGDGIVGPPDMGMLLGNWGPCYGDGGESFMEPPGGELDEETIEAWIELLIYLGHDDLAELLQSLLNES